MISVTLTNDSVRDKLSDLGLCVFIGNLKRAKKLLKKNDINSKFTNDNTLLHICSHNEDTNMFYFLLSKGCDYKHINENGDTSDANVKDHVSLGDHGLSPFANLRCAQSSSPEGSFDMDSYELLDLYKKKEQFYGYSSSTYTDMFNLLMNMRHKK
ncbi:conserved Plasmodium protein, unknown function [Plasmodium ovale curtisi]|uniref:Uncharacterized protein n=1 Tax=Plasmodium ovale curtisi TaxID=864141 RepID=A0A1A8VN07_PLAOA|nr:conserved Plasmodium protein, unknown function [Plasmodium ovale curtisi]